jgi:hypothetical protein
MVFLVPVIVIALAVAVRFAVPATRRLRMTLALRGDWWSSFEREFRAYASRAWESARESERGV